MDKRHSVSAIIAGCISLVACLQVAAQSVHDGTSADHILEAEPGHFYYTVMPRDGEVQRFDLDLTEDMQIIVEFEEAPLFVQQQKGLATTGKVSAMQRRFAQFEADLEEIYQHLTPLLSKQASAPKLERTFYKVFYGASLTVPRIVLGDLQQLDYVQRIHLNKKMEAYLNESVALIRADEVQQTFGTRGENVVVAIIDTGIDYMHPALGGGFGEGFKVIGGYDFVNDDADPMDDNGHGTHVAGIVAADGEDLQGVAPGVSLMAYKVLNGDGGGEEADIIAAIERVADPNEDGDFSDHVAVANMSLGGPGNPDDAVSMAVDHAVSIGVTFCIAAGNTGSFRTIGSPGTAAAAITVGASDKSDQMAFFSAKGPVSKTYAIKPDLVAPGVEIHSAALQEGVVALGGTSMAAPHVAGVATLLKAIHPTWEPADIKSALMTTAVLFSDEAMVQGSGRIDAAQAAQVQVFIEPSHLSFGLADVASSSWETTQTLLLTNRSPESQAFSVSFQGTRSGINLTVSPSSFTIDPGEQQQVEVTLRVNHDLVPFPIGGSLAYSGTLTFNNATQSLHLPWAFVKAARAVVTYDQPFPTLLWANEFHFSQQAVPLDPYTLETTLPAGEYDLMLIDVTQVHERVPFIFEEGARIFIKEGLNVDGAFDLTLHSSEASLLIDLDGQDEQGQLLSDLPTSPERLGDWYQTRYRMLYPSSSSLLYVDFGFVISDKLNVSAISDRFTVLPGEFYADLGSQNHAYAIQHTPITGIQEDVTRATTPADLSDQPVRVVFPPGTNIPQIRFMNVLHNKDPGHTLTDAISYSALDVPEGVWDGQVFVTPAVHANYAFTTAVAAMADNQGFPVVQTQPFRAADQTVHSFLEFSPSPVVYQPTPGEVLTFGAAPIHPNIKIKISNANGITSFLQFYGPHHEERIRDGFAVVHTLYDEQGTVLASDEGVRFFEYRDAIPPGAYRLETVLDRYFVDDEPGKATLNVHLTFDANSDDFDAPTFTSLRVLNEQDRAVSRLTVNEAASLTFSAADYILSGGIEYKPLNAEATRLSYRRFGTDTWQPLALATVLEEDGNSRNLGHIPIGLLYKADLSALTTGGDAAFDLRISIEDESGKVSEWTLEPGFLVGDFEIPVGIEDDPAAEITVPDRFQLHANYPNPFNPSTTIRFDLPAQERVSLKIYDTLGREVVVLVDEPMPAGKHTVPFDARGLASGMYLYRLETSRFSDARTMILLR